MKNKIKNFKINTKNKMIIQNISNKNTIKTLLQKYNIVLGEDTKMHSFKQETYWNLKYLIQKFMEQK